MKRTIPETSRQALVEKLLSGPKDESGAYIKESPPDLSIDGLMLQGLEAIHGTMKAILRDTRSGIPSRESVQNLKDCMSMLADLKEREADVMDKMSNEELEKVVDGS